MERVNRLQSLDGLRGLAVLGVVLFHAAFMCRAMFPAGALGQGIYQLLGVGMHGVDLFFILSGFCLAYPYLEQLRKTGQVGFELSEYAAKRILRIIPPYWMAIALLCVVASMSVASGRIPLAISSWPLTPWDVVRQAFFLDRDTSLLNTSFWTLAIEARWYFLMPVLLFVWIRLPRSFPLIIVACIVLYSSTFASSLDLLFLPAFMLGIAAASMYLKGKRVANTLKISVALAALGAVVLDVMNTDHPWPYTHANLLEMWPASRALWGVAAFGLVTAGTSTRIGTGLFTLRPLRMLGTISYSLYLLHEPVELIVKQTIAGAAPLIVTFVVSILASVVVAALFYRFFERPLLNGPVRDAIKPRIVSALRWAQSLVQGPIKVGVVKRKRLEVAS